MKLAILSALTSIALVSCGTKKEDTQAQAPQAAPKASAADSDAMTVAGTMPKTVFVVVPVVNGKELNDQAVLLTSTEAVVNADNVAKVVAAGKIEKVSELDQTSSTQSFFGWRRGGLVNGNNNVVNVNYGQQNINGSFNNNNSNNQGWGGGNWRRYRPACVRYSPQYGQQAYGWAYANTGFFQNVNVGNNFYGQGGFASSYSSSYSSSSSFSSSSSYSGSNVYPYGQIGGYGVPSNQFNQFQGVNQGGDPYGVQQSGDSYGAQQDPYGIQQ